MTDNSASRDKDTVSPVDKFAAFFRPKQHTVLLAMNGADSDFLSPALKVAGCVVLVAGDVRSSISEVTRKHPDVVVLDYSIADSIQAARQILAMRSATKIIMILGNEGVSKEIENMGIELFLKKPLSIQRCVDAIITVARLCPPHNMVRK